MAKRGSSKQSNEILAQTDDRCQSARGLTGRDRVRPNRDEFIAAKQHAEEVLGLDPKVSAGLRQALKRFANSPLTYYMEVLNDPDQAQDRRMEAATRLTPFLHRKLEDKHGAASQGNGAGAGENGGAGGQHGLRGPTINLSVNRPAAININTTHKETPAKAEPVATPAQQPEASAKRPTVIRRKKVVK